MLITLLNLAFIILGFTLLIFVHELGHFLAAKWAGVRTQAFAIGMGPVVLAWRQGVGLRVGSTGKAVEQRVRAHLRDRGEEHLVFKTAEGEAGEERARSHLFRAMDELRIGETEYSLRALPIGGFVSMLGQEDANPAARSGDPRSYQNCAIWKRMVIVSAGVAMNLALAVAIFVAIFLIGLPQEAPIVGAVDAAMPAATATAREADRLGIAQPGIQPGDRIVSIDGVAIETFGDAVLEFAMSRGDRALPTVVERSISGRVERLTFDLTPRKSPMGLLAVGIGAAQSARLVADALTDEDREVWTRRGLLPQGIEPGMRLLTANGESINTYADLERALDASGGGAISTEWVMEQPRETGRARGAGGGDAHGAPEPLRATFEALPELDTHLTDYKDDPAGDPIVEQGLLGFSPLVVIDGVPSTSPNADRVRAGDVVLRLGDVNGPRLTEFYHLVGEHAGETLPALLLRDGAEVEVDLEVNREGRIGVLPRLALHVPMTARPIVTFRRLRESLDDPVERVNGPLFDRQVAPLTRITAVGGEKVSDWATFRAVLREATRDAFARDEAAAIELEVEQPTPGRERTILRLDLSAGDIASLHALGWTSALSPQFFQPEMVTLTAHGNPITAIGMGFKRTWKFVLNVYLTIDRLFRGTLGVEQLRGPVGIVHLGVLIADQGLLQLVFLLALISVNLAVINFLPMPIVDGGLFLFLVYEKFKGRPPSVGFQNAATLAGLAMIVCLFLVVTYNDIARLITG